MDEVDPERDRDGLAVPWEEVRRDYELGRLTRNGIAHRYRLRFLQWILVETYSTREVSSECY